MIFKPRLLTDHLRSSMWVLPLGLVALMIAAAHGLLLLDKHVATDLELMAGASMEGARGMLQVVAGSMITVAGVVFSLTLLVLSQASAQYSPRVLRNFLRDRVTQTVLGVFVGIYAYCLVVLRGMGDKGDGIPGLTVTGGLVAALLGVVYLIFFFHHIAQSLQLENIVKEIEADTLPVIERLYPQGKGIPEDEDFESSDLSSLPRHVVTANRNGYIQDLELDALLQIAERLDCVIHVPHCVGIFITHGSPLAYIIGGQTPVSDDLEEIGSAFSLGRTRSIQQDPAFGIRQLVDIALKALSPGMNDTSNAIMVLDRINVLMRTLATRPFPRRRRLLNGKLRLVVERPGFQALLNLSLDQIRHSGSGNPAVLRHLLDVIGDLLAITPSARRRALLLGYARRLLDTAERHISDPGDLASIRDTWAKIAGKPQRE